MSSFRFYGAEHVVQQRPHGFQPQLVAGPLVGDIALSPLARRIKKAALPDAADVAADIGGRRVPAGKGGDQTVLLAVVIKAKGMADIGNDGFIQRRDFHVGDSFLSSLN